MVLSLNTNLAVIPGTLHAYMYERVCDLGTFGEHQKTRLPQKPLRNSSPCCVSVNNRLCFAVTVSGGASATEKFVLKYRMSTKNGRTDYRLC